MNQLSLTTDIGRELAQAFRADALEQIRAHARTASSILIDRASDLQDRNAFDAARPFLDDHNTYERLAFALSVILDSIA